ncbi:MAG: hypothetical protein IH624_20425, partial [Phycisphaerae bacterium]|nr:hypothetical protein [Phycisphaerae bacterium]
VLQIAYWFNPLLWVIRRPMQELRELCCDATVARVLRERTGGYRETLLETARRLVAEPVSPGMGLLGLFENSHRLVDRLRWLERESWRRTWLRAAVVLLLVGVMLACVLPMAKGESNKIGWLDRKTLVKFGSNDGLNGSREIVGDTITHSKTYDVTFRKGEKLLVFAELYQTGQPMRRLGHKVFEGDVEPRRLSVRLTEEAGEKIVDGEFRDTAYRIEAQLGDERLDISTRIPVPVSAEGLSWGWFQSDKIATHKINDRIPACQVFTLLRFFRNTTKSNEFCRLWVPCTQIGEVGEHKQVIELRMVPVSQLGHIMDDIGPMVGDQVPDGTFFAGDDPGGVRRYHEQYSESVRSLLVPLPKLSAHRYYEAGTPIKIEMKQMAGDWKPSLEEIYFDDDHRPVFVLVNGKEYSSRLGVGPFGGTTQWLTMKGIAYQDLNGGRGDIALRTDGKGSTL